MNSKNMAKHLKWKMDDWFKTIDDEKLVRKLKDNVIVTGGALVSLINNEQPHDYDVYIKDYKVLGEVAQYYANKWNENHSIQVEIQQDSLEEYKEQARVRCFIGSVGAVTEEDEDGIDDETEPYVSENEEEPLEPNPEIQKPKYRPRYFSTNAITLSDKIQLVIRFWGPVDEIHKNYDFVHCTCSYDYQNNKVNLPTDALECIINKELKYVGSRYPLCSIIRTRKYIQRGYSINAGQYLKMCLQLNKLDLTDLNVFKDQLTGVDSAYFNSAITAMEKKKEENPDWNPDNEYLFEIINRIF